VNTILNKQDAKDVPLPQPQHMTDVERVGPMLTEDRSMTYKVTAAEVRIAAVCFTFSRNSY
jgi:hypothetical protein